MRTGAIILFLNGYCYQSYGWNILRPLGNLQNSLDHLERYQVDEISIIRPIRGLDTDKAFYSDMTKLSKIKSATPLSFGGGLYNQERVDTARSLSFERLIFSSNLFFKNSKLIDYTINTMGKQAVLGSLPFKFIKNKLMIFNSVENNFLDMKKMCFNQLNKCDELLLYDCLNEGKAKYFDKRILENSFFNDKKIIISGGVNLNSKFTSNKNIASMLIENRILHKEYSIKR